MDAWIAVFGTLFGGILGGVLTHWTAHTQAARDMRWQIVRLAQDKLEELAQVLDEIERHYTKISGDALLKVEFGKEIKMDGGRIPHSRLSMLVDFYAPELAEQKTQLDKAAAEFGEVLVEAIRDVQRTKPEKQALNGKLMLGSSRIEKVCKAMAASAAALARTKLEEEMSNNAFKRRRAKTRAP